MLSGFKQFVLRGNVVDLQVAGDGSLRLQISRALIR
jgi:hypothetical protein